MIWQSLVTGARNTHYQFLPCFCINHFVKWQRKRRNSSHKIFISIQSLQQTSIYSLNAHVHKVKMHFQFRTQQKALKFNSFCLPRQPHSEFKNMLAFTFFPLLPGFISFTSAFHRSILFNTRVWLDGCRNYLNFNDGGKFPRSWILASARKISANPHAISLIYRSIYVARFPLCVSRRSATTRKEIK